MKMIRVSVISILMAGLILAGTFSCNPAVTQEEYDGLLNLLDQTRDELAAAQQKGVEGTLQKAQYDELSVKFNELTTQFEALTAQHEESLAQIASLETQSSTLNTTLAEISERNQSLSDSLDTLEDQYQQLKQEYDALIAEAEQVPEINEVNIENALFDLINQYRTDNGLNALIIGSNLRAWALLNCQEMVRTKTYTRYTDSWVAYQDTFWATGYSSVDRIIDAALTVWQSNAFQYEANFLSSSAAYGAVRVVKSGDIYYITYMASDFP